MNIAVGHTALRSADQKQLTNTDKEYFFGLVPYQVYF